MPGAIWRCELVPAVLRGNAYASAPRNKPRCAALALRAEDRVAAHRPPSTREVFVEIAFGDENEDPELLLGSEAECAAGGPPEARAGGDVADGVRTAKFGRPDLSRRAKRLPVYSELAHSCA